MPYIDIKLPSSKTRIIAFSDNEKNEIVATGYKIDAVKKRALAKGCKKPFLMSVPPDNTIHLHSH